MKVARSQALSVCKALGLHAADKWDNKRMGAKMEALPDLKDVDKKVKAIEDKDVKNLADAILTALEEEKPVQIVDDEKTKALRNGKARAAEDDEDEEEDEEADTDDGDEEDEEEEEAPKKGKGGAAVKAKKKSKAVKAKAKKEKGEVKKDSWGFRQGTRTARINAAISAKPKSAQEIQKEAKSASAPHSHLYKLLQMGLVVKDKDGNYRRKK